MFCFVWWRTHAVALEWGTVNEYFLSTWSAAGMRETGSMPVSSSLFPPSFPIFSSLSIVTRNWVVSKKQPQQCPAGTELKHGQKPELPRPHWFAAPLQQRMLGTLPGSAADCPATWHLAWNVVVQQPSCDSQKRKLSMQLILLWAGISNTLRCILKHHSS